MTSLPRSMEQLDDALLAFGGFDSEAMLLTGLDGFVAGLLVCPELVPPHEWLPIALGREDGSPDLPDGDAVVRRIVRLVLEHCNVVSRDLHGRGGHRPVFDVDLRHDETLWELCASGFGRAMEMRPQSWAAVARTGDEDAMIALAGMRSLVAFADNETHVLQPGERTEALTRDAPDLIPLWVETLDLWRVRYIAEPAIMPARSTKVGRNEACPCGSGKKHKKCCGLN